MDAYACNSRILEAVPQQDVSTFQEWQRRIPNGWDADANLLQVFNTGKARSITMDMRPVHACMTSF
jgi:hypothetical protein